MNEKIQQDYDQAIDSFLESMRQIETSVFNKIPFEGSWTAGELAQHVILSAGGFAGMLNGPTKETQGAPDERVAMLKQIFLDFKTKMKSPDFILPESRDYDKDELISKLKKIKKETDDAIGKNDLALTFTGFELPTMGFLTGIEAVTFVTVHTLRHTHQMKNIAAALL